MNMYSSRSHTIFRMVMFFTDDIFDNCNHLSFFVISFLICLFVQLFPLNRLLRVETGLKTRRVTILVTQFVSQFWYVINELINHHTFVPLSFQYKLLVINSYVYVCVCLNYLVPFLN